LKIKNLTERSNIYTSNVYLITGTWNAMSDVNTLIDVGRDVSIVDAVKNAPTGVGKRKVEQVILTHSHYDHVGILKTVKEEFNSSVFAFSKSLEGVDFYLRGGENIKISDSFFEIIHMPGHSNDSICLYNREEEILFSGDSPLVIHTDEGYYDPAFIAVMRRLTCLPISTIYFGHGPPMTEHCNEILSATLRHITKNNKVG
jgi:glyoxylase-like metal-dependent hydrolase (beta-lactamase superfamily II)